MEKEKTKIHQKRRRKSKIKQPKHKESLPLPTISEKIQKVRAKPSKAYIEEELEIQRKLAESTLERQNNEKELEILFFTSNLPCAGDEITEEESIHSPASTKSPTHTSPTHLASSYLAAPIEINPIEQFKTQDVIYNENLLFYPSKTFEQDDEEKVLSDTGIFKASSGEVLKMNQTQMVNRCLEEGNILALNLVENGPTVKLEHSKTIYKSQCAKKFTPIFVKPEPLSNRIIVTEIVNQTLNIFVHKVEFNSHPLLDEGLTMEKKVKDLFQEYKNLLKRDEIHKLQNKLEVLRSLRDQLTDEVKIEACKDQIKETRRLLYKESKYKKDLILEILQSWKHLKGLGSENLNFSIIIHTKEFDEKEDLAIWEQNFQDELDEVLIEEFEVYHQKKLEYKERSKEERLHKPRKPEVEKVKDALNAIWLESFRNPGDPEVILELKKDQETIKQLKIKYFIKVFLDNQVLTSTESLALNNDFSIHFDSSFSTKLTTHMVKEIKFEVYESSKVSQKIGEVFAVTPLNDESILDAQLEVFEFSYVKKVKGHRYTGKLYLKLGWENLEETVQNKSDASLQKSNNNERQLEISKETVKQWHEQLFIDPMDPDAQRMMHKLDNIQHHHHATNSDSEAHEEKDTFNFLEDELVFCSKEELDNNERLNLLIARWNKELKFKDSSFIPLIEREIELPESKFMFDEIEAEPIDVQRYEGKKYLKKVYESITSYCEKLQASRQESAILIGDQVPTFGSLSLTFFEIFGAKRPLKPTRRTPSSTKSAGRHVDLEENFNIIITIVRAFGVPQRNEEPENLRRNSNLSSTNKSLKGSNVRPFVIASIKNNSVRTSSAEGFNPTWNEQLSLLVNSKLGPHKHVLSIDLFDECVEDYVSDDRRITEVYQRWLGQLQFPLETIYQNQRIEGTFEMTTPPLIFGYNRQNFEVNVETSNLASTGFPNMREVTHLSLFINLEPLFEIPRPLVTRGLECIELEDAKSHIDTWYIELREEFPWRCQSPYIILLNGKRACITRLLGALEVPTFEGCTDETLELYIRRFVSLIPVYTTFNQCITLNGAWLTNEEIFKMICSSPKDLAVLLTCYYLSLGKMAWLILGYALPVGETCFVLLKEEKDYFIVDAMTGKKYDSTAVDCPLKKVYSLANDQNYWANIQTEKRVFMTQFDVKDSALWRPLFKWSKKAPTGFLQNGAFQYKKSFDYKGLQKQIELKLIKKINTWRSHKKTTWNRYITENLRKVLVELEEESLTCNQNPDKHLQVLNRLFTNYKVTGFPLNFRYTNISTIVNQVKCTGIHLTPDSAVEFAVASYIKDYGSNIFSVWVYIVSMTAK